MVTPGSRAATRRVCSSVATPSTSSPNAIWHRAAPPGRRRPARAARGLRRTPRRGGTAVPRRRSRRPGTRRRSGRRRLRPERVRGSRGPRRPRTREVTATREPAGLVQDLQRLAAARTIQRHAGVLGVGGLPAVEVEEGQRGPVDRVVARGTEPGRGELHACRLLPAVARIVATSAMTASAARAMATASSKRSDQASTTARRPRRSARRSSAAAGRRRRCAGT